MQITLQISWLAALTDQFSKQFTFFSCHRKTQEKQNTACSPTHFEKLNLNQHDGNILTHVALLEKTALRTSLTAAERIC